MGDKTPQELDEQNKGLIEIKDILEQAGIFFTLEGGVLLGAVREKGFLPWDDDVGLALRTEDIYTRKEELVKAFSAAGFTFLGSDDSYENFKIELSKYGCRYELLGWYLRGNKRRRKHHRMPRRFLEKTEKIAFLGQHYNCPSPPEQYLSYFFRNWRVPQKSGRFFKIRSYDQKQFLIRQLRKVAAFLRGKRI